MIFEPDEPKEGKKLATALAVFGALRFFLRSQEREASQLEQPKREPVRLQISSGALDYAQYDEESASLRLWFDNGKAYEFLGFPASAWERFRTAGSYGRHFNLFIRDVYTFRTIA